MESTYLFIDGGYLKQAYTDSVQHWFGNLGEIDFRLFTDSFKPHKIFYYDCEDKDQRANESENDFKARLKEQDDFFCKVREIPGCHVRLGHLVGSSERRRRQKEVDIRLAVDMLNHAVRRNMTKSILISGDRDFKPLVESLVNMGIHVELAADEKSASQDLAHAADSFRRITFEDYHAWSIKSLQSAHPTGVLTINRPPEDAVVLKTGTFAGDTVTLHKWRDGFFYIQVPHFNHGDGLTCQYHDMERLQLYFRLQYGDIAWN
jgi:uncharacterized LabA/DUF88 family protein